MISRKKRNFIIISLSCLLVFLGVGYAYLSSTLTINSTSKIDMAWNFEMDITCSDKSSGVTNDDPVINSDKISGSIKNYFSVPGDYITYTVTVKNLNKINALIYGFDVTGSLDKYEITNTLIDDTQIKPNETYSFTFTIKLKDSVTDLSGDPVTHTFKINVEQYDSSNIVTSNSNVYLVSGNKSDLDVVGSELRIGDESFYVISSDSRTVTLIAKYNLLVGSSYSNSYYNMSLLKTYTSSDTGYNLQSYSALGSGDNMSSFNGVTIFSNDSYWSSSNSYGWVYENNDVIKQYVDNYKNLLESMYSISINEARLISKDEVVDLGCEVGTCRTTEISNNKSWLLNTSFWTGTAGYSEYVYIVNTAGDFTTSWYKNQENFGVRPVITIYKKIVS